MNIDNWGNGFGFAVSPLNFIESPLVTGPNADVARTLMEHAVVVSLEIVD